MSTEPVIAILVGLIVLVWSADRFVAGAAALAHNFGMPHILIGVTIVSLGTSAPEILVSIDAAIANAVPLALGNALGSNIANMGMVLGLTILVAPLAISSRVMKSETTILLVATLLTGYFLYDLSLSRTEGILLSFGLCFFLLWLGMSMRLNHNDEYDEEIPSGFSTPKAVFWLILGLALLLIGARALVWGATEVARVMNISELVIGATIVAIGTSLPELATSMVSAARGHNDIALGNVLGSNIFNLLAVISVAGVIRPTDFSADVFWRDYLSMLFLTGLLALMILYRGLQQRPLGRVFALVLLVSYVGYLYLNFQALNF